MGATLGHKKAETADPEASQSRKNCERRLRCLSKKTKRTSSDRAAQLFAIKITRTNTEKFSGLNEHEILILLLGKVPALYD